MRARAPLIALLLAASLLSGCVASDDEPGTGSGNDADPKSSASATQVDVAPTASVSPTTGGISGFVASDVGARLKGAHVALAGTEHSATTNSRGEFAFGDLEPAQYHVRVDHMGYSSYEGQTDVDAGRVTILEVTLVASASTPSGFRDHVHDFWLGETRKELFKGPLTYDSSLASGGTSSGARLCLPGFSLNGGNDACYRINIPIESPRIIYPGTRALELTVKWTESPNVGGMLFKFLPANFKTEQSHAVENRKPLEVPIPYEWNDHGHQTNTQWRIDLHVLYGVAGNALSQGDLNRRLGPTFSVELHALKGDVPTEEPHKAYWAAGDRLVLVDKLVRDVRRSPPTPFNRDPRALTCANTDPCFHLPQGVIVPPGTTRLLITLEYAPGTAAVAPHMAERVLSFRTAAVSPHKATLADLRIDAPANSKFGNATWSLPIKAGEADAFYQKSSLWLFMIAKKGEERADSFHEDCVWTGATAPGCGGTRHLLTIVAVNDEWTPDLIPPETSGG